MGRAMGKCVILTCMQSDQGLLCLVTLDTIGCMNGEQRPGSSCSKPR